MEQHKVLLIVVSVAVVLAAIIGVGLWLFYPRSADDADLVQAGTPVSGGYEWQPLDYLQGQGDLPGLDEDGFGEIGELDEFRVTYGVVEEIDKQEIADRPTVIDTVSQIPFAGSAEPGGQPAPSDSSLPAIAAAVVTSAAPATTESFTTAESPTRPSTASTMASGPELADQAYWVQAISSPNRDTVEQSRLTLREHQLGSRILTKLIAGRTFYRLRIGPFAVRAEAEKFLGWVQEINDFSDAMIFVDYTTPVLAARAN